MLTGFVGHLHGFRDNGKSLRRLPQFGASSGKGQRNQGRAASKPCERMVLRPSRN
jgi:hypothetical protein